MTNPERSTTHVLDAVDSTRLAYTGGLPTPVEQARRARKLGWLRYAEHYLGLMRGYLGTILIESIGTPLLYLLALGVGLGTLVDRGVGTVDGVSYLEFVSPAILVATVMMAAMAHSTYDVMAGFKWQKHYLGAQATPISPAQIAMGHLVGGGVRYLGQASIFWLMMLAFGVVHDARSLLVIPITVASAFSLAAPLQAYAATIMQDRFQFSLVERFIIVPMTLFAGTYFPLSSIPIYLRWIGWISPMWHGTQLARRVSYGMQEPAWLTVVHVLVLVIPAIVGALLACRFYRRRLWGAV